MNVNYLLQSLLVVYSQSNCDEYLIKIISLAISLSIFDHFYATRNFNCAETCRNLGRNPGKDNIEVYRVKEETSQRPARQRRDNVRE